MASNQPKAVSDIDVVNDWIAAYAAHGLRVCKGGKQFENV